MRKFLIGLLIVFGIVLVTTLFFIGNPRNQFVKMTTRKAEDIYDARQQKQYEKILNEQELIAEKERQKLLAEETRLNNLALKAYNS